MKTLATAALLLLVGGPAQPQVETHCINNYCLDPREEALYQAARAEGQRAARQCATAKECGELLEEVLIGLEKIDYLPEAARFTLRQGLCADLGKELGPQSRRFIEFLESGSPR